jgi:hypothetical protein
MNSVGPFAGPGAPGPRRYLEVVALDCVTAPPPGLLLKTILNFLRTDLTDGSGSVLEYRLADNQSADGGDGLVTVDEGSLVVRQVGTAVEVVTTKRVQFRVFSRTSPFTAAGLAWFVWLSGYSWLAAYFIERVTGIAPSKLHEIGSHRAAGVLAGCLGDAGHHVQAAAAIEQAFDECWHDVRLSLAKMAAGQYGAATYAGDAAKLSGHLARHGTLMLKFWADLAPGRVRGTGLR